MKPQRATVCVVSGTCHDLTLPTILKPSLPNTGEEGRGGLEDTNTWQKVSVDPVQGYSAVKNGVNTVKGSEIVDSLQGQNATQKTGV